MMFGSEPVIEIGALCFGVVVGYITYRTLVRAGDKAAITDLAAVLGAVGGAAVIQLFQPGTRQFGWYGVGLLGGMALFFLLYGFVNGWRTSKHGGGGGLPLAAVMSGQTTVPEGDGQRGPGAPTAR